MRKFKLFALVLLMTGLPSAGVFGSMILTGFLGNDLTDLGDNGVPGNYTPDGNGTPSNYGGFDAQFFASERAMFAGREQSFQLFANNNTKTCCGTVPGFSAGALFGATIATGNLGISLTHFTLTSTNDSPGRDPGNWKIEGSLDTTTGFDGTWTTIFDHPGPASDWASSGSRNQTIGYGSAYGDAFLTTDSFKAFRFTADGSNGGTDFALNEIEFFGNIAPIPEPSSTALLGLGGLALMLRRRR